MKKLVLLFLICMMSGGCLSYMVYKDSQERLSKTKSVVGFWDTITEQLGLQVGALAGDVVGGVAIAKSLEDEKDPRSIEINGEGNTVIIFGQDGGVEIE
jgi:hypothetical protein